MKTNTGELQMIKQCKLIMLYKISRTKYFIYVYDYNIFCKAVISFNRYLNLKHFTNITILMILINKNISIASSNL